MLLILLAGLTGIGGTFFFLKQIHEENEHGHY